MSLHSMRDTEFYYTITNGDVVKLIRKYFSRLSIPKSIQKPISRCENTHSDLDVWYHVQNKNKNIPSLSRILVFITYRNKNMIALKAIAIRTPSVVFVRVILQLIYFDPVLISVLSSLPNKSNRYFSLCRTYFW